MTGHPPFAPPDAALPGSPARQRLLLLVDHSLDVVEVVSEGGTLQSVSSAVTVLAGYQPDELLGRPFTDFVHADDRERARQALADVLALGSAGPVTLRYRCKNGRYRTVEVTARNFLGDPLLDGILVFTRDLTDLVAAEHALTEANDHLHRLSQELLVAQEAERAHLARELHDDILQALAALRYGMGAFDSTKPGAVPTVLVESWDAQVADVMQRLRRVTRQLRPPAIDHLGLKVAVEEHVTRERMLTKIAIRVAMTDTLGRLPKDLELAAFRIIQEALANALRHAGASVVTVSAMRFEHSLIVTVTDNGVGFAVPAALERSGRSGRIGLQSIYERAALLGGRVSIESGLGKGTTVQVDFPLPTPPPVA